MGQEISREKAFEDIKAWKSFLDFVKDEMRFFQDLLDKYFIDMISGHHAHQCEQLIVELNSLSFSDLYSGVQELIDLQSSIDDEEQILDKESLELYLSQKRKMKHFNDEFTKLKRAIFGFVEEIRKELK